MRNYFCPHCGQEPHRREICCGRWLLGRYVCPHCHTAMCLNGTTLMVLGAIGGLPMLVMDETVGAIGLVMACPMLALAVLRHFKRVHALSRAAANQRLQLTGHARDGE